MDVHDKPCDWDQIEFFEAHEFRCNCGHCDGTPYMDHTFMVRLDQTRRIADVPFIVNDGGGYRCPRHPDRIKRPGTYHNGRAADIRVTGGAQRLRLNASALKARMGGHGFARTFYHMDGRPWSKRTSWTYREQRK